MSTDVNVTAEHIENGVQEDCEWCPIALAARTAFPGTTAVVVDQATLFVTRDGLTTEYALPDVAWDFVTRFDWSGDADPFEFTVTEGTSYEADPVTA